MPRPLKRRSDAISRDTSPPASPEPSQRRTNTTTNNRHQRSPSTTSSASASVSDSDTPNTSTNPETSLQTLSKKLIRLALSSEYARIPLRRTDITLKIFKDSNASPRLFKPVFAAAQSQLRNVFGMQLVELPSKDKTSLRDRRTQATQTQQQATQKSQNRNNDKTTTASVGNANKSWILTSTLPTPYKTSPAISLPTCAPTRLPESQYTALYTFIVSLIYLNNSSLPEPKLERYLRRVNADTYTPVGSLEKLLARMVKEGYLEKRRDTSLGPADEVVEYSVGPRGKIEVGSKGVAGLVRSVYGFGVGGTDGADAEGGEEDGEGDASQGDGDGTTRRGGVKIERDELEKRLKRSLGVDVARDDDTATTTAAVNGNGNGDDVSNANDRNAMQVDQPQRRGQATRSSARNGNRNARSREDDDEEEEEGEGDDGEGDEGD